MNKDINFTDKDGNEFYVRVREHEIQVWKNKEEIKDVRFYVDEIDELTK